MSEKPHRKRQPRENKAEATEPPELATREASSDGQDAEDQAIAQPPARPLRPGQFGYHRDHWP